jgi:hypothetical protein
MYPEEQISILDLLGLEYDASDPDCFRNKLANYMGGVFLSKTFNNEYFLTLDYLTKQQVIDILEIVKRG